VIDQLSPPRSSRLMVHDVALAGDVGEEDDLREGVPVSQSQLLLF
jgi:hypothetical protein